MKTQGLQRFIAGSIWFVVLIAVVVTGCGQRKQFEDLPGLLSAMQAFSQDLTKQGRPLPSTVSLGELVGGGYISSNSFRAFEGMEVKIWLTNNNTEPQAVLMCARLEDGSVNAVLADGSVQQMSGQRFAEHLKRAGQQDGPANGIQPLRSETNGASSAAASRR